MVPKRTVGFLVQRLQDYEVYDKESLNQFYEEIPLSVKEELGYGGGSLYLLDKDSNKVSLMGSSRLSRSDYEYMTKHIYENNLVSICIKTQKVILKHGENVYAVPSKISSKSYLSLRMASPIISSGESIGSLSLDTEEVKPEDFSFLKTLGETLGGLIEKKRQYR